MIGKVLVTGYIFMKNVLDIVKLYCTFSNRSSILRRINPAGRSILERVVSTVKFLSVLGLPFFGSDEKLNSHNGNFFGIMELISQYDPSLSQHLKKHGNLGNGHVNDIILSFTVSEFIDIMANKVLNNIIENVKQAKYFGLIADSTTDITHNDHLDM